MSRYDASTVNDLTELVCLVADVLQRRTKTIVPANFNEWKNVAEWIKNDPYTVNLALEDHDRVYRMCHECGAFVSEPEFRRTGLCVKCRDE